MFRTFGARRDGSAVMGVAPFDRYRRTLLAPLAPHADRLDVAPGTVLALEGRPAREVLVIVRGEVVVTNCGAQVGRLGPGAWVGAHEVLAGTAHGATVLAGDDLAVLVLTAPAFRWAAQTLPDLVPARPGPAARPATWPAGYAAAAFTTSPCA